MAINDKDFYASHGLDFDIEKMQIEYTKRVIKQAKIEVLTELQTEIEEIKMGDNIPFGFEPVNKFYEGISASSKIIQQKIDKLKENKDAKN